MTANQTNGRFWLVVVNALTAVRLVAAPLMIAMALAGEKNLFLLTLLIVFSSDVADGALARLTGQKTAFGAQFDSIADFVTYTTIAISVTIMWPDLISAEYVAVATLVASFVIPPLIGFAKFGWFTSYHTILTKIAAATFVVALFAALWGEWIWPVRYAALIAAIAALEEIAITVFLREPESNIRSLFDLLRNTNRGD